MCFKDLQVLAVVFDGSFTNQSTAKHLGCKMKVSHIQPWFQHPHLPNHKVYVVLDICLVIKLMQNLLADCKVICSENNDHTEKIEWSYIEQLNQVQEDIGFSLANKLKKRHILWKKHKMSVPLAVQTLSASVAHSLDFLWG